MIRLVGRAIQRRMGGREAVQQLRLPGDSLEQVVEAVADFATRHPEHDPYRTFYMWRMALRQDH